MPRLTVAILALTLGALATGPARAQDIPVMVLAKDLLLPCQEADNDPRDGFISQLECMGFIRGFVAALELTGEGPELCVPEANRDDTLRRAYVSWVHASFSQRSKLPVGEALLVALDDNFACE